MTNSNKLKAKIVENGYNIKTFAKELGISSSTLSEKINNRINFSQKDIKKIHTKLHLTPEDVMNIFFS